MVDKKSDHYTSATTYRDMDGNHKNFTFIDHDKKPTISASPSLNEDELKSLKQTINEQIDLSIDEILAMPAQSCFSHNGLYEEFIVRDVEQGRIEWQKNMLRNACRINHTLRHNLWNVVWRNTVKSQYWFEELSHEDIIEGKWKQWI